jgi:outer membrane protein TolC
LYPHFSITGSIFFDANNFKDLFKADSVAGNAGPSFRWDILNYGRLVNNIRVQDARFQQLAVQYQNTVLQANAEAENAVVAFLKTQVQAMALAESTNWGNQSLDLAEQLYYQGQTDFNRVFNVQQSLTQQQDLLAQAQGAVATNLILLYKALGGGWQIRLAGPASASHTTAGQAGDSEPAPSADLEAAPVPPSATASPSPLAPDEATPPEFHPHQDRS